MPRDIDISLIRTFLAVAESGGMTSAASALNLTQGAISQKISRLEALFETQLFDRTNKSIRLTPDGERLMARAHRMVAMNDEVWQFMTQPAFVGEVKLGVSLDIVRPVMPAIMRRFNREHPRIQLILISDLTENLLRELKKGQLDLILTTEEQYDSEDTLLRDRLVWIGAQNGEACFQSPLPVSLGSDICAFRKPTLAALNRTGIDWLATHNIGNLESTLATVEADMAVAPWMSCLVPDDLTVIDADVGLPELPAHYINLRMPDSGGSVIGRELAKYIRQGFAAFQSPVITKI